MAYIYNPAQAISEKFKKTEQSVQDIFGSVIAEKQMNFQFAQDLEANIEALKKDITKYNEQEVYNQTEDILSGMGSIINEKGKIDFNELRNIRSKVNDVKRFQINSRGVETDIDQAIQMLSLDKGKTISNIPETYANVLSVAKDTKAIINGTYQAKIKEAMNNGTNIYGLGRTTNPLGEAMKYEVPFTEKKKFGTGKAAMDVDVKTTVKGEVPAGFVYKDGGWDITDEAFAIAKNYYTNVNPQAFELVKNRIGETGMSDDQLLKEWLVNSYARPIVETEDAQEKYESSRAREQNYQEGLLRQNKYQQELDAGNLKNSNDLIFKQDGTTFAIAPQGMTLNHKTSSGTIYEYKVNGISPSGKALVYVKKGSESEGWIPATASDSEIGNAELREITLTAQEFDNTKKFLQKRLIGIPEDAAKIYNSLFNTTVFSGKTTEQPKNSGKQPESGKGELNSLGLKK